MNLNDQNKTACLIERDLLLSEINKTFQANWNMPCSMEDKVIQRTVAKVMGTIMSQPVAKTSDTNLRHNDAI